MSHQYEAIVVGGGHNGLVAAGYLAGAGLRVAVLERRSILGGPAGRVEFMPGYRTAYTNSPGSLEPKVVQDLELQRFGLEFVRPDPTMVQPVDGGAPIVGWRQPERVAEQLDRYSPGDGEGYRALLAHLQWFADSLAINVFSPPPTMREIARRLTTPELEDAYGSLILGPAQSLLDAYLTSDQAKALLGVQATMTGYVAPSAPGSGFALLLRPLSLASYSAQAASDPRQVPLRGSTGLPIGSMGAIVDAMRDSILSRGGEIITDAAVETITIKDQRVLGVVTQDGREFRAPTVISNVDPYTTVLGLIPPGEVDGSLRRKFARKEIRGGWFKVVLGLRDVPYFVGLDRETAAAVSAGQFRIAPSVEYIERAVRQGLSGVLPDHPTMWGLMPSVTSPGLAPAGRHLMSLNVGPVPYRLAASTWEAEREEYGKKCIDVLSQYMPSLPGLIEEYRFITPVDMENDLGLVEANITQGDLLPWNEFAFRPAYGAHRYRIPGVVGLYLCGSGTWPGGYVSGIPGHNAAQEVLRDLKIGLGQRSASWEALASGISGSE